MLQFLQDHLSVRPNEMIHTVWIIFENLKYEIDFQLVRTYTKWKAMDQIIETGRPQMTKPDGRKLHDQNGRNVYFEQKFQRVKARVADECLCISRPSTFERIVHLRLKNIFL